MKKLFFAILFLFSYWNIKAQVNPFYTNPNYNQGQLNLNTNQNYEINANPYRLEILTKVLYNAKPDGYHLTYSKSFISKSVEAVELMMNKETDALIAAVKQIGITQDDVWVDVVSLDPVFEFYLRDTMDRRADGYKITENITFKVKDIALLRHLSKICLDYEVYDLLKIQPFIENAQPILDTLMNKSLDLLNRKKSMSESVGWKIRGGNVSFKERTDVFYPNERYLKSIISNQSAIYQHQLGENTTVQYFRQLNANNYNNYNHKQADYVYHANVNEPVIQFYMESIYTYKKPEPPKEEEKSLERVIYMMGKDGNLQQLKLEK